ncbi:22L [Yaba monkey tumor virus]|uniref:22L n=1 Tax=Yaba monkey tumor virus (strain VR587) TaxID=928314 RepID=Q6TUZ0_YMTV5|nr:22L [Yaba monkey tumor virus]AAR07379.1 22L [Yaba monkey tumor virus]
MGGKYIRLIKRKINALNFLKKPFKKLYSRKLIELNDDCELCTNERIILIRDDDAFSFKIKKPCEVVVDDDDDIFI